MTEKKGKLKEAPKAIEAEPPGDGIKVVHFTDWAPRKSGMFGSTRDQVKYERRAGLNSHFCDTHREKPEESLVEDGWFRPIPWEEAKDADIFVMHSFIPEPLKKIEGVKKVAILHGPSEHMLMKEWFSQRKEMCFDLHIRILWTYDATVVINQHEFDIMEQYDEKDRLHYIPNSIDLERYTLKEDQPACQYTHRPAIGSFDVNRIEKLPAHILWAMPRIVENIPDARLNLMAMSLEPIATFRNILCKAKKRKLEQFCENIQLQSSDLRYYMRGVDMVFNNNMSGILSRVGMQAMTMGIPVIAYNGDYCKYKARIWDLDSIARQVTQCWSDLSAENSTLKQDTLDYATKHFDRAKEVQKYVKLYEELVGE